jgi:aspartokinase-like uncharacterized kinase
MHHMTSSAVLCKQNVFGFFGPFAALVADYLYLNKKKLFKYHIAALVADYLYLNKKNILQHSWQITFI